MCRSWAQRFGTGTRPHPSREVTLNNRSWRVDQAVSIGLTGYFPDSLGPTARQPARSRFEPQVEPTGERLQVSGDELFLDRLGKIVDGGQPPRDGAVKRDPKAYRSNSRAARWDLADLAGHRS